MDRFETVQKKALARTELAGTSQGQLWAIVLAGGEGVRLRALTRRLYGEDRPKQYAALCESGSLLRMTLDRVALAIPAARQVVVTVRSHARYMAAEFARSPIPHVLVQPESRGTAAGVLFPAHWIHWRDPEAIVAVFPSDHFILEETAFMNHVAEVVSKVRQHPEWIVLFGAQPTEPETGYGWIEPAELVDGTRAEPIWRVHRFWEKPSPETAHGCLASGCLWNTLVLVAKVSALVEVGWQCLPALHDRLARIAAFAGTEEETWAVHQAYQFAPHANFSRSILQTCPAGLVVSRLPAVTWCDWGTPDRVLKSLSKVGVLPAWSRGLDLPA